MSGYKYIWVYVCGCVCVYTRQTGQKPPFLKVLTR